MKAYSIFLIAVMIVNFGIMGFKRNQKDIFIVFGIVAYSIFVFWNPINLDWYPLLKRSFILFFALIVFILLLYKQHRFNRLTLSFFTLFWVVSLRNLGFPENENFGEKGGALLLTNSLNLILMLWTIFLIFHKRTYQKILLGMLSAVLITLLYEVSGIEIENLALAFIITPFYLFGLFIGFITLPITFLFFYLGEVLLLFFLCYEIFFKASTSPIPKES